MAENSEGHLCWQQLVVLFENGLEKEDNVQGLCCHNLTYSSALMSQLAELGARAGVQLQGCFQVFRGKKGIFTRIGRSQFYWEIAKGIQSLWGLWQGDERGILIVTQ